MALAVVEKAVACGLDGARRAGVWPLFAHAPPLPPAAGKPPTEDQLNLNILFQTQGRGGMDTRVLSVVLNAIR